MEKVGEMLEDSVVWQLTDNVPVVQYRKLIYLFHLDVYPSTEIVDPQTNLYSISIVINKLVPI